jgi:hypothetical protein
MWREYMSTCYIIPYTKRDQHFTVDLHNEILIYPLIGKLKGLGFRGRRVFFTGHIGLY